ncbi:hypothetical protein ACFWJ4_26495 [Kitasatospora sp. NPDC127067]|uniref:hypothetical protein n=1 Tax=Kitasatospora sp. NPDC127067 TaxID=3347126 RepID=UPI003666FE7F
MMVIHRFKRHRAAATGHDELAVRHEATVLVEAVKRVAVTSTFDTRPGGREVARVGLRLFLFPSERVLAERQPR